MPHYCVFKMSRFFFVAVFGALLVHTPQACLDLAGIVSGGGDGQVDLDVVSVSVEKEPFDLSLSPIPTVATCSGGLETPISMRNLLGIDTAAFSVSEMFHPNHFALDIFGDKETSDARRRCQPTTLEETELFDLHLRVGILYAVTYGGRLDMPFCEDVIDSAMEDLGLPMSLILEGEPSIDTPWGLAKAYIDETFQYLLDNDGWNADGSMSRTYNRIPFSDYAYTDSDGNSWKPYKPRNPPWDFKENTRWQPLMQDNGLGYISSQMHVTPHIGALGRFYGFNSTEDETTFASRELKDPDYDYDFAAEQVLYESRLMAEDDFKQAAVEFFDNKFASLIPLKIAYFTRDLENNPPLEFYRVTICNQLAIYNGVVLTWKEKVHHDLPRPPSVITDIYGDDEVEAYAGPGEGAQIMKASEWESFITTMPHTEFPSASACMCKLFQEQLVLYTGSDIIDPLLEFPIGENVTAEFSSWSEVSDICGDSRLWGGMHFYDAVPAGVDLCGGELVARSVEASIDRLIAGDETAAVFKSDPGELKVRDVRLRAG